jgi:hypothetical protein
LGPFTIGGSVTGLTGTVVLQNNGKDDLSLTANGSFTFATKSAKDATYAVTVLTQPSGQICTVNSGGGTATDNVTTVSVDCVTQWAGSKQLGGVAAPSFGQSVAVDASGNVYVVGETTGSLDGKPLVGTTDLFITKYDLSGVKQSTQLLGLEGAATFGRSVAIDASGNVYVAGFTNGKLGLDPKTTGDFDSVVIKYNSKGVKQYIKQLGVGVAGAFTLGYSVAVDANLNVYVAGVTSGSLLGRTLTGSLVGSTLTGTMDSFVAKYDSQGDLQYTRQWGVAQKETSGSSVTTDASGNVYVAGYTTGGLPSSDAVNNVLMGDQDAFVSKYNSGGDWQYTHQLGVLGALTTGSSVAVDSRGNVYVVGDTTDGLSGNQMMGKKDFFVAKYSIDQQWQYTNQLGVAGATTVASSVAVDATGSVYLTGETNGQLYVDTLAGTKDLFVAKLNGSGVQLYLHQLGVAGQPMGGQAIALDTSGNIYIAGSTLGVLDVVNVPASGQSSFFVTKYDNNGVKK